MREVNVREACLFMHGACVLGVSVRGVCVRGMCDAAYVCLWLVYVSVRGVCERRLYVHVECMYTRMCPLSGARFCGIGMCSPDVPTFGCLLLWACGLCVRAAYVCAACVMWGRLVCARLSQVGFGLGLGLGLGLCVACVCAGV